MDILKPYKCANSFWTTFFYTHIVKDASNAKLIHPLILMVFKSLVSQN